MVRRLSVLIVILAITFLATSAVYAAPKSTTRPGWGFGDTNHVHTGPPGHSVSVNIGHPFYQEEFTPSFRLKKAFSQTNTFWNFFRSYMDSIFS